MYYAVYKCDKQRVVVADRILGNHTYLNNNRLHRKESYEVELQDIENRLEVVEKENAANTGSIGFELNETAALYEFTVSKFNSIPSITIGDGSAVSLFNYTGNISSKEYVDAQIVAAVLGTQK
jgi:hypothetical protein